MRTRCGTWRAGSLRSSWSVTPTHGWWCRHAGRPTGRRLRSWTGCTGTGPAGGSAGGCPGSWHASVLTWTHACKTAGMSSPPTTASSPRNLSCLATHPRRYSSSRWAGLSAPGRHELVVIGDGRRGGLPVQPPDRGGHRVGVVERDIAVLVAEGFEVLLGRATLTGDVAGPGRAAGRGMRAGLRGILVGHRRRVTIAAGPGQGRDDALVPVGAKAVAGLAGRQLRPGPGNHALDLQVGADDQAAAADEVAGLGLAAVGRRLVIGPGQPLQDLQ